MLNTNSEYLRSEIMDVIRAFGAEQEDFTHYFSCACGKFYNSIEYNGGFYDFEEEYGEADEIVFKRLGARLLVYALLKLLIWKSPRGAILRSFLKSFA